MAYMSQERKKEIAETVKPILKKYGVKGTFGVDNHSTLVLTLKSGKIDFKKDLVLTDLFHGRNPAESYYMSVNPYWYQDHFSGKARKFLKEIIPLLNKGNHDNSDISTDYFDVGWYVDVKIGKWNKPYILEK